MTSLLRRTGNKFLVEIDGFGPFPSSAAAESLLEMAYIGQRIVPKIMKNNRIHQLNSKTVEAIKEMADRRNSEARTIILVLRGLQDKTLEVKVSLLVKSETKNLA